MQDLLSFESCRSSAVDDVENISLESSGQRQNVQVVMSEIAGRERTESGEDAWRREPEGETETLETKLVSHGVEGVNADPNGEGRHERVQVKTSRRQSEAPGEEGEEVKSPIRKVIRVESEETQDYVRAAKDLNQEDAEETSFAPSATSVPQKPLFRCDNRCSEKTLSFWQFASVVTKESEESYTTKLCQQCYNESRVAKRR